MYGNYDFIVIGAGPAGCVCAGELKKRGYRVCVLEKHEPGYRKVCGDGIGYECVKALRSVGFPAEAFARAGAVRISRYIHYIDGEMYTDRLTEHGKEAYGMGRDKTDSVFRQYLTDALGVPILFKTDGRDVRRIGGCYEVCGLKSRGIIIAAGASGRILLDGEPLTRQDSSRPVGISGIVQARRTEEPFFMFDYREEYKGTYSWIFSTGEGEYNVGLWLKSDRETLRAKFELFLKTRVMEYLGGAFEWRHRPRGAVLAIGERPKERNDAVLFVGDAANTTNTRDGEGLSMAVKDALALCERIEYGRPIG